VIDIGVGRGFTARLVADLAEDIEVTGLDVRDAIAERVPLVLYDGGAIPFRDAAFDVALLHYTLHHAEDPRALLAEAARVTRRSLVVIEEFERGGDVEEEERKETLALVALGLPPDMPHVALSEGTLEAEFSRRGLRVERRRPLRSDTPRRVEKRLYVLEIE